VLIILYEYLKVKNAESYLIMENWGLKTPAVKDYFSKN